MKPEQIDLTKKYLKPGELIISSNPMLVTTILGSCVSIVLHNERLGVGAISHGLLASCRDKEGCNGLCDRTFHFVDCSFDYMLFTLKHMGMKPAEINVRLFGGAETITGLQGGQQTVGRVNVEMARRVIDKKQLKLRSSDVGGERGRKLYFNTLTGEVLIKRLRKTDYVLDS